MDTKQTGEAAPVGLNWRNKPRRSFSAAERLAILRECEAPGVSVAEVAQRNRVNANLLFKWKRLRERGLLSVPETSIALVPVAVVEAKGKAVKRTQRPRAKAVAATGYIEIEIAGARLYLRGPVSEASLATVLRVLGRT
jgi:transposase